MTAPLEYDDELLDVCAAIIGNALDRLDLDLSTEGRLMIIARSTQLMIDAGAEIIDGEIMMIRQEKR